MDKMEVYFQFGDKVVCCALISVVGAVWCLLLVLDIVREWKAKPPSKAESSPNRSEEVMTGGQITAPMKAEMLAGLETARSSLKAIQTALPPIDWESERRINDWMKSRTRAKRIAPRKEVGS